MSYKRTHHFTELVMKELTYRVKLLASFAVRSPSHTESIWLWSMRPTSPSPFHTPLFNPQKLKNEFSADISSHFVGGTSRARIYLKFVSSCWKDVSLTVHKMKGSFPDRQPEFNAYVNYKVESVWWNEIQDNRQEVT